ncbi:hypothetical protein [Streptomyces sp. TE5632]
MSAEPLGRRRHGRSDAATSPSALCPGCPGSLPWLLTAAMLLSGALLWLREPDRPAVSAARGTIRSAL